MRYWTYAEIRDKVRRDLGIQQEEFISDSEMLDYCNMAIDDAESEIHTTYEDYFLTTEEIDLVAGKTDYTLPTDIYASKIRGVIYNNGTTVYKVRRYTNFETMFEEIELDSNSNISDFMYFLSNNTAESGIQMVLNPVPTVDESSVIKMYYIRNANRMVDDTSVCDIPEFVDYVMQFMKVRCYEKEGHPNFQAALGMLDYKKKNMINTLSNMVPDGETTIKSDTSFYWDMESDALNVKVL